MQLSTDEQDGFRLVMSQFCTGVVIVAGASEGEAAGLTCQAFSALSLDPPLVALGVGRGSTSWPAIRRMGRFCVSILSSDQHPLALRFAVSGGPKFSGLDWIESPGGAPIIPGCVAWVDCRLESQIATGDHYLVVGAVEALGTGDLDSAPLVFFRRAFGAVSAAEVA
jgi:3-hydroxy-9,10-secoandrosta-1,3,5(10)-triene-9,17-dione monooxygenase reductase component